MKLCALRSVALTPEGSPSPQPSPSEQGEGAGARARALNTSPTALRFDYDRGVAAKLLMMLMVVILLVPVPGAGAGPGAVRVIFDTDMDSDCDDAGALAMLHALADRGEAVILATMVSSKHVWSGPCTDAINTYYGRGDLPIGVPHPDKSGPAEQGSKYARRIAEMFPHDFPPGAGGGNQAPHATPLYRSILAAQPDGSVVIVTVGDLTNLRYLLESTPDEHSPLAGPELVRRKVARWVCMGSRYPADLDPNRWGNFKMDPESTVKAVEGWPTPIIFTGGGTFAQLLGTGRRLAETAKDNPVRRAYELYFDGEAKDRHSADQIAVMVAVRGADMPWLLVSEGRNEIFANGTHAWRETPDNPLHHYVSALRNGVDPRQVATAMEELMIQPPRIAPMDQ